jgi:hypothetical protein
MRILESFTKLDRRIVFLLITLGILIPLLLPLGLAQKVTSPVENVFDFIETVDPDSKKPILLSTDYDASVLPEVYPMTLSILRHAFSRGIPVIGLTLHPAGTGLGLMAMNQVGEEYGMEYGKDYAFLGYKAGISGVILGIGESIEGVFPTDYYGESVSGMQVFENVRNYDDIALVITFAASSIPESWVMYANSRYSQDLACGVTAVMAADFYPYLQTGQFVGMLAGMKGAAEYETLLDERDYYSEHKPASRGMDANSIAHLLIIAFVIIGNIGFLASRKGGRK